MNNIVKPVSDIMGELDSDPSYHNAKMAVIYHSYCEARQL